MTVNGRRAARLRRCRRCCLALRGHTDNDAAFRQWFVLAEQVGDDVVVAGDECGGGGGGGVVALELEAEVGGVEFLEFGEDLFLQLVQLVVAFVLFEHDLLFRAVETDDESTRGRCLCHGFDVVVMLEIVVVFCVVIDNRCCHQES